MALLKMAKALEKQFQFSFNEEATKNNVAKLFQKYLGIHHNLKAGYNLLIIS